jgi:hypothetical protein
MKQNRIVTLVFLALVIAALTLSACGPKATPEPVTLTVKGLVNTELQLSDSALHKMTVVTLNLTHPKNGPTNYTGVRLSDLLAKAGVKSSATSVIFTGSDGYTFTANLSDITACADCMVAFDATPSVYDMAMPGMSGKAWVSKLITIELK